MAVTEAVARRGRPAATGVGGVDRLPTRRDQCAVPVVRVAAVPLIRGVDGRAGAPAGCVGNHLDPDAVRSVSRTVFAGG